MLIFNQLYCFSRKTFPLFAERDGGSHRIVFRPPEHLFYPTNGAIFGNFAPPFFAIHAHLRGIYGREAGFSSVEQTLRVRPRSMHFFALIVLKFMGGYETKIGKSLF